MYDCTYHTHWQKQGDSEPIPVSLCSGYLWHSVDFDGGPGVVAWEISLMSDDARWKMIAASGNCLFALDTRGDVYKYIPKDGSRYAFWTRLTNHKAENRRTKEEKPQRGFFD